jgi:hypothetical protein
MSPEEEKPGQKSISINYEDFMAYAKSLNVEELQKLIDALEQAKREAIEKKRREDREKGE